MLGAGPAALAVSAWLGAGGVRVACLAPDPPAPWQQRFGMWADELPAHLSHVVAARFDRPLLVGVRTIERAYLSIDTAALQRALLDLAVGFGVNILQGRAVAVEENAVVLDDGGRVSAQLIVDASGARSRFVTRVDARPPAYQSAFGLLVEVASHPYRPGEMAFMDLRDAGAPPTFLYALPLGDRVLFAEETSLAARPAMPWTALQQRLWSRLARMGVVVDRVVDRELCLIPLGTARPRIEQPVVAFGAAAALTHPASGYQLGRALALAPKVARAIASHLDDPKEAARAAYQVMWPLRQRRAWELYTLGMEVLVALDAAQLGAFMAAFFELEPELWRGYLDATLEPTAVARAMLQLFAHAPGRLRHRLARLGLSQPSLLWGAIAPGGIA